MPLPFLREFVLDHQPAEPDTIKPDRQRLVRAKYWWVTDADHPTFPPPDSEP
jgi:hypothetical protein